jgi:general stress protein 26
MHTKKDILDFMNKRPLMVISSLNEAGLPQSAAVGFGATDNLQLVFGTSKNSRKAHNIRNNGAVSVVIGWDMEGTIQLEGTARPLEKGEVDEFAEVLFMKNPRSRAYRDDPDEQYFLITPTWIRYTDVSQHPWNITELEL